MENHASTDMKVPATLENRKLSLNSYRTRWLKPKLATVAVIIPTLNEAAQIRSSIHSAWASGADEVIISDGGSSDATVEIAEAERAHIVLSERGRGQQLNAGLQSTRADIVIFLHADCSLDPSAVQQIQDAMRSDGRHTFGAFRQKIQANGFAYRLLETGNLFRARWLGLPYGDQAIFALRDSILRIDGVPEIEIMEDVELVRRLARGGSLVVLPGPVTISARRWQAHGIVRQTLRNWAMLSAYFLGATPRFLARFYRRHDQKVGSRQVTASRDSN